jgi:hypothetical protein
MLEGTRLIAAEVAYPPGTVEFIRRSGATISTRISGLFKEMMTLHDMTIAGSHYLEKHQRYSLVNAKMVTTGTGIARLASPEAVDTLFSRAGRPGPCGWEPGDACDPLHNNDLSQLCAELSTAGGRPARGLRHRAPDEQAFNALINHIYLRENGYVTLGGYGRAQCVRRQPGRRDTAGAVFPPGVHGVDREFQGAWSSLASSAGILYRFPL